MCHIFRDSVVYVQHTSRMQTFLMQVHVHQVYDNHVFEKSYVVLILIILAYVGTTGQTF